MQFDYSAEHASALAARWWMLVVRGAAAVLFGLAAIAMPTGSLFALLILWGAYATLDGVFSVLLAAQRGWTGRPWGWLLFEGTISLGVGLLTLLSPGMTALVLLSMIALRAVFNGIAEIAEAIRLRRAIRGEWLLATCGVLSVGFGVAMLIYPGAGAMAVAWIIGAYAMTFGALLICLGLRVHHLDRMVPA